MELEKDLSREHGSQAREKKMERAEDTTATAPKTCATDETTQAQRPRPNHYPQTKPERVRRNRVTGKWLEDRYDL